jgi:hypothetical protein
LGDPDQNASADLKTMDNGALQSFVTMAQQFAAQIQNIMGSPSGTVNSNSNAFGFSKTAPGVKQQKDTMDLSTNQITKILENFLRQYALVALDTLFCEQDGEDTIVLDDETKDAINQVSPGAIGDDNTMTINWTDFYAAVKEWSVEISVSLSKDELDDKKRGDLQDLLVVLAQNAQELGPDAIQKVQEITNMLLKDKAPSLGQLPVGGSPAQATPASPITAPEPQGGPVGGPVAQ